MVVGRDQLRVSFHGLQGEAPPLHVAALERSPARRSLWSDGLRAVRGQVLGRAVPLERELRKFW